MIVIRRYKILFVVVATGLLHFGAQAQPELKEVRELLLEQKTAEAISFVRDNENKVLRNDKDRQQLAEWLSVFYKENTLNNYERAMVAKKEDPAEAKKLLLLAHEEEPYNKLVLTSLIALLLQQKEWDSAREKINYAQKEMGFLSIYKIYARYLERMEASKKVKPGSPTSCEKREFNSYEKELCGQLALQEKAEQARKNNKELIRMAERLSMPNKYLILWQATQDSNYQKKYLLACQNLSNKDTKNYGIIPDLCVVEGKDLNVDKEEQN